MNINKKVLEIEVSDIRKIAESLSGRNDVVNMTIGEPDLDIPNEIKESLAHHALNTRIKYAPLGGLLDLREAITDYYNRTFESNYAPDEVIVTVGSTEALSSIIKTLIVDGDEVIIPKPAYVGYEPLIHLSGGKSIFVDTEEDGFILTREKLEKSVTEKTKMIILTYPNNPSGVVMPLDEMKRIVEFIKEKNIYLLSDEIYSSINFDGYNSFASFTEIKEKLIVINGFSKSHSMTGYRVGYLLAEKELRKHILKVSQYTVTSPATLSQYAAIEALKSCSDRSEVAEVYKKRALLFIEGLEKIGFKVVKSEGAFYIFANYSKFSSKNSYDFVMELIENAKVAAIPGSAFHVEGYIRFSLVHDIEILEDAINRLEKYLVK